MDFANLLREICEKIFLTPQIDTPAAIKIFYKKALIKLTIGKKKKKKKKKRGKES
jgi:hypothetical protein